MNKWYSFNDPNNGEPIAYVKNLNLINEFISKYSLKGKIEEIENPSHLEFILKKEEKTIGYFESESHALMYNHLFYKGKGFIEPNPQE